MDPLSIASGAAGLAAGCAKIGNIIYTWIQDTIDIDVNVSGLCEEVKALTRVLESISNASIQIPQAVITEIDPGTKLLISIKATMNDIETTLDKLSRLLADIQKSSFFTRGFLRKSAKQIRLSQRLKDITALRERMKSYNSAMTSALQMLNVCLLLHNNSSQESIFSVLSSLESHVRRVELTLQVSNKLENGPAEAAEEKDRIFRNLKQIVRVADDFHSNASIIVRDGARSTVWGGSALGDPLTKEQLTNIESWISPPTNAEERVDNGPAPTSPSLERATETGNSNDNDDDDDDDDNDDDDDIDKDLTKRFEELAVQSQKSGDLAKAEKFYRRAIERGEATQRLPNEILAMKVDLAFTCMRLGKWTDAETILTPIAWEKKPADIKVFHGLHGIALFHMETSNLEAAERYCKRSLWGKTKVLGKSDPSSSETLSLLATICDTRDDPIEAEAHRSFLPQSFEPINDSNAIAYLDRLSQVVQPQAVSRDSSEKTSKVMSRKTASKTIFTENSYSFSGEVFFATLQGIVNPGPHGSEYTTPILLKGQCIEDKLEFEIRMKHVRFLTGDRYSYDKPLIFDTEIFSFDGSECPQYSLETGCKPIGKVISDFTYLPPGFSFRIIHGGYRPYILIEYILKCWVDINGLRVQGYFLGSPIGPTSTISLL